MGAEVSQDVLDRGYEILRDRFESYGIATNEVVITEIRGVRHQGLPQQPGSLPRLLLLQHRSERCVEYAWEHGGKENAPA